MSVDISLNDETLIRALNGSQECQSLTPEEKETIIRFSKDEDIAHVYTEHGSAIRRLLLHPQFSATEFRVCGPDDNHPPMGKRVKPVEYTDGAVTGVEGIIPIGCLSIRQSSRSTAIRSNVVAPGVLDNDPRKVGGEFP